VGQRTFETRSLYLILAEKLFTLPAASEMLPLTGRRYIGIEMNDEYFQQAAARMERVKGRIAARRSSQEFIPTSR
jgi:hypothetical protein